MPIPGFNPYQVKPTDKDLLTIAAQQGLNYPDLKAANPSITSVSTGQFINIPKTVPTSVQPLSAPTYGPPKPPAQPYGPPAPSIPYGPPKPPATPLPSEVTAHLQQGQASPAASSAALPYVVSHDNFLIQVGNLKNTMENATDPSQLPSTVVPSMANAAGYTAAQMLQAGYQMQNGNWVRTGTGAPGTLNAPQTGNNYQTNPRLRMVLHGRNAHNRQNRYWETAQHANTMYKRKKHGVQRTEPINNIRADTPSTTLDVVLGS